MILYLEATKITINVVMRRAEDPTPSRTKSTPGFQDQSRFQLHCLTLQ